MKLQKNLGIFKASAAALAGTKLINSGAALVEGKGRALPVASDADFPEVADVVVIGGGIIGACAALCLAERGLSVTVCEKGVVAGEASGRAGGWINGLYVEPESYELICRTKKLWYEMNSRIGTDTGYQQTGLFTVCRGEELSMATEWVRAVKGTEGFDPVVLDSKKAKELFKFDDAGVDGALFHPSDASVEPRIAAPRIIEAAQAKGAIIQQYCAARSVDTTAGKISAVVTEKGVIRTMNVILAGNIWSPLFCRNLGLELPQLHGFATQMSVAPLSKGPTVSGGVDNMYWRCEADGGYSIGGYNALVPITRDAFRYGYQFLPVLEKLGQEVSIGLGPEFLRSFRLPSQWAPDSISPFEAVRVMQPVVHGAALDKALRQIQQIYPAFNEIKIRERWAGALATTPDHRPVISSVDAIPGLFIGSGFYFGITLGPAAGELLADLVTGETPKVSPKPYLYERLV